MLFVLQTGDGMAIESRWTALGSVHRVWRIGRSIGFEDLCQIGGMSYEHFNHHASGKITDEEIQKWFAQ
jgi:hypothetical protein